MIRKGYYTGSNYMGFVGGKYMQFESEEAYVEYLKGDEDAGTGEEAGIKAGC